jgi:hypothetical protein
LAILTTPSVAQASAFPPLLVIAHCGTTIARLSLVMSLRSLLIPFVGLSIAAIAAACTTGDTADSGSADNDILEGRERRAVGRAQPYPADEYSEADAEKFAKSKKLRRELGWKVLAKALKPVKIAEQNLPNVPGPPGEKTVPLFRTFLGPNEIDLMFAKMYGDLGKERRAAGDAPTDAEVDALFDYNAKNLGQYDERAFFDRMKQVNSVEAVDGLGGNTRAAYSPGYAKFILQDYKPMSACTVDAFDLKTKPISEEKNFTNCFSKEMPADAAVIKMSWRRNDELSNSLPNPGLAIIDTSAPTLKKRLSGELDDGGWKTSSFKKKVVPSTQGYSVRLPDESVHTLVGLHVMSKELRHWVWVTVWWSDKPDEDFGQDRPEEIKKLGPAWSNYKMCVVTDFEEKDTDPTGGFDGSLGDALAAVHGKATWCSNGFIEKDAHNAQTNCIGCHQHAGDTRSLNGVLTDPTNFPESGRLQVRKGFPADYSWAIASPPGPDSRDPFLPMFVRRIKSFDQQ